MAMGAVEACTVELMEPIWERQWLGFMGVIVALWASAHWEPSVSDIARGSLSLLVAYHSCRPSQGWSACSCSSSKCSSVKNDIC